MMQRNSTYPKYLVGELGTLHISEVFDYYDGPKVFTACDAINRCYFVFWADEEGEVNSWFYVPVSQKRLRKIRLGVVSLKEAILGAETNNVYFIKQTGSFEFVSKELWECDDISEKYLPPEEDCLEYRYDEDEHENADVNTDMDCFLRLRFSKSGKSNIYLSNITSVLNSFKEYMHPLLKSFGQKGKLVPLSAMRGSFIINLGLKESNGLSEVLQYFSSILLEKDIDKVEEYLRSNNIDPDAVFNFINALVTNKVNLDIMTSYDQEAVFEKNVSINLNETYEMRDMLEIVASRTLSSIDVPQADEIDRLFKLLWLARNKNKINSSSLGVVARQVSYYKQAARILKYFDSDNNLTKLGSTLLKNNDMDMLKITRFQFETSKCGWAWLKWCDAKTLYDVDIDSAASFIIKSTPGLSESTAKRRAQTLRSWHKTLTEIN